MERGTRWKLAQLHSAKARLLTSSTRAFTATVARRVISPCLPPATCRLPVGGGRTVRVRRVWGGGRQGRGGIRGRWAEGGVWAGVEVCRVGEAGDGIGCTGGRRPGTASWRRKKAGAGGGSSRTKNLEGPFCLELAAKRATSCGEHVLAAL